MRKKARIFMGGIIILTVLSINFMFSKESTITDITIDPDATCIYVGTFCFGVDANGNIGNHFGLSSCKD